jgi:DNA helicase-2/ATP-dependent DNA helicase PcrA
MSKNWSAQQKAIFEWFRTGRGNLVVRARAGTGKTTTILEAVGQAPENKILLAAFNTRIARELEEKLGGWKFGAPVEAKTLNGLGFQFVKYAWGKDVQPDDSVEMDRVRQACGAQVSDGIEPMVLKLVSRVKNAAPFAGAGQIADLADTMDLLPSQEQEEDGWPLERIVQAVVTVLNASKTARADRKISFDDQVWLPVVLRMARPWYQMVVIDEAQDMNATQLLLAQAACKRTGRIAVVGDDRQAIYGFRGADSGAIDRLKAELKAVELGLTITYRCAKAIVAKAQALVPDYCAADSAPEGLIDSLQYDALVTQAKPGDFVLSRKNAPLMSTCLRLLRAGIPARVEGRDIGKGLAGTIKKFRARSVPDFLKRLAAWQKKETARITAKGKDVEAKIQVIDDQFETLAALADGAANVEEIVERCFKLFEDSIEMVNGKPVKNRKPAVVCSSVHKAKGLEADRVFILVDAMSKRKDQEELNIEYVAITRAKSHLTLVSGLPGVKAAE